ncbi:ABC transporter permease [Buttiauxella izardii]|uniref:ABC transporter permease subunit n=1 Tax=Buttiauxella izardii TaxID=82991 RepID=A0A3A5K2X1_9ENTR|nr:ABC transporter permease subunit [Buttiauxella izardii]RJT26969.1 ABC transporter permease subunit [Buttiauxella izardii]
MSRRLLAWLAVGCVFAPLLPGLMMMAKPALLPEIWQALWADNQWPLALLATLNSTVISVAGALAFCLLILCGLWPGARWQRYTAQLPLLLALPHVAFASGFLLLFADNGWLARLCGVSFHLDEFGVGLGFLLALKESWFLLWIASSQLNQQTLSQQLTVAQSLGYGPLQCRVRVLVPQLLPRLKWALMAVVAYSLSVVDVAIILGPANPPTLAVLAWQWLNDADPQRVLMGMLTSLLLLVLLGIFIVTGWTLWKLFSRASGKFSGRRHQVDIQPLASGIGFLMTATGIAAIAMLLMWSFSDGWFYPSLFPDALAFSGWQSAEFSPLVTTLLLALASSLTGLLVIVLWLEGGDSRFDLWLALPLFLPALPLVAGQYQLLLMLNQDGGWLGVIWSHLLWVVPYMLLVARPAWQQFDARLVVTARTFGWSAWKILCRVKLPLLMRPMLATLAVGFSVSVAQYLPTLYAGAGRFSTVTTETVALSSGGDPQQLAIQALLQMLLPAIMFIVTLQAGRVMGHYRQGLS